MENIENRMTLDWQWPETPPEVKKKMNGPGWKQIGTNIFVPEEDAFDYAIERCTTIPFAVIGIDWTQEFKEMLVEWFYSDNWIWEGDSDGSTAHV